MVKKGRTIFLTKKNLVAKTVPMPNLKNISLIQANAELSTIGLQIGKLDYRPSRYENLVIEQKLEGNIIKPGIMVEVGTVIDLVVGRSSEGSETIVPDLFGLSKANAVMLCTERSLNIGVAIYDNSVVTHQDTLTALIYKQSPNKNWKEEFGEEIDIWLTLDSDKL